MPQYTYYPDSTLDIQGGYVTDNQFYTILYLLYFNKRYLYIFQLPLDNKGLKKGLAFKVIRISVISISKQLNEEQYKLSKVNK